MTLKDFKTLANKYPEFDKILDIAATAAIAACDVTTDHFFEEYEEVTPPPYKRIRLKAYRIAYKQYFSVQKTERQKLISRKKAEIFWGEPLEKKVRKPKKGQSSSL